tara:strand:+ start:630 stop:818 length:189 start_codon:yes stop_codon:yes gene_type:complete
MVASRTIDADKIKTMDDVRLLFKAMDMRVQPHASHYSELEHLFKEKDTNEETITVQVKGGSF